MHHGGLLLGLQLAQEILGLQPAQKLLSLAQAVFFTPYHVIPV